MPLATYDDAMREYARNVGAEFPDHSWLLTDWDVWVRNPHYVGPPQPHPEADIDYEGQGPREDHSTGAAEMDDNPGDDDLPF